MLDLILFLLFGYLLGSIPFGYLICKTKGKNIQQIGSGVTGGTNVARALGIKFGILVGILDIVKAAAPVYLALRFFPFDWQIAAVAVTPILGHIFPVWLKFKGGKGVASTFGVIAVLLGWKGILVLIFIQILAMMTVRIMAVASLTMAFSLPVVIWSFTRSLPLTYMGIVLTLLIWWAHRENLQRLKERKEPKIKFTKTLAKTD